MGKRDGPPPNPAGAVTSGQRWLAIDADLFGKRFTDDLYSEFGWAGVVVWVAYLCACKRSATPGRITFLNDVQAAHELGIDGWDLVDNEGKTWELSDFWTFTGRKKQTRRTPNGRRMDVTSTHWERWQDDSRTQNERERKRRWWAENRVKSASSGPLGPVEARRPDSDSDSDIPPTPARRFASNGTPQPPDPPRPPIAEWHPDPEPTSTIDRDAIDALRTQHGWMKPEATDG